MIITIKGRVKRTEFEIQGLESLMATADYQGTELTAAGARVELTDHEILCIMRSRLPIDPDARARYIRDYLA